MDDGRCSCSGHRAQDRYAAAAAGRHGGAVRRPAARRIALPERAAVPAASALSSIAIIRAPVGQRS
ncbi:hypothetical protein [Streptomyces rimosus]|uniref:hypothetical protein n=1 Tax=Streptomyces rimosus TaxID=1927 RepID=UPI00131D8066|nr:hypothetical protein [Streptomyces rimosus]